MTTSTILYINTGTSANKGDGDSLRLAFHKVNKNFELLGVTTGFDTNAVKDSVAEIFTQATHYGIGYIYNTSSHVMVSSLLTATSTRVGGIKPGAGISISGDGTISAATAYVLPTATNVVLGGVRVGVALAADQYGVLNNTGVTGIRPSVSQPYRTGQVTLSASDIDYALGYPAANANLIGALSGIATLDGTGKVPLSQMNEAVLGGLNFQGTWNASSNLPLIQSGVGSKGYYYKVSIAGTTNIDGVNIWNVGDLILYNGTAWLKIDGTTTEVLSVAGRTGDVVLSFSDINGNITRSAFSATSTATNLALGTIKLGQGLVGAVDGTVNVSEALLGTALPATTSTLGVIKVGPGLLVTLDGTLSAVVGSSGNITLSGNEIQTIELSTDLVLRPTSGITKFYNTLLHMGGNNNLVLRTNQFLNAGIATDSTNFSLRIVGDSNAGTTLFDAGVYNSPIATTGWTSKFLVRKSGDAILQGNLEVKGTGGIKFSDGTSQTTAASLTTATFVSVGGIIVGNGLQISGDGTLSTVLGTSGGQVTDLGPGTINASTDTGNPGEVQYDGSYMYLCVATDKWIRIPITVADVPGAW
jgi:hypothetical protein